MALPDATVPGPGPYLQRLMARRDACPQVPSEKSVPDERPWLSRLLRRRPAPEEPRPDPELVFEIVDALNKHDPAGLIGIGAPEDEYASEARQIALWMPWVQDEEEMHGMVFETFYMAFHVDIPAEQDDEEKYPPRPEEDPATFVPIAHDLMTVRQRRFVAPGAPGGPSPSPE